MGIEFTNSSEKYLAAIVILLLEKREGNDSSNAKLKPEIVLFNAGFKAIEIASLLKKNLGAVRKVLERNK